MMEKKLDTFEELMLDFLAGKLSEDGERKLLHFLQSDISYQQRYKEMARTRAKSFIGKFEQEKQADYEALSVKLGIKKKSEKKRIPLWRTFSQVAAIALLILTTSIAGYYIYNDVAERIRNGFVSNGSTFRIADQSDFAGWFGRLSEFRFRVEV